MAFIDQYVDDKRWTDLQSDPQKLSKARDKLFAAYLVADPARKAFFVSQGEDEQRKLQAGFIERITKARPDKFEIEVEPASSRRKAVAVQGSGFMVDEPVPAVKRMVADPATEDALAQIRSGQVDPYKLPVEAFKELGPLVDWGAPEVSDHWRAAAKSKLKDYSPGGTAARNVLEGMNPISKRQASFSAGTGGPGISLQPSEQSTQAATAQEIEDWVLGGAETARKHAKYGGLPQAINDMMRSGDQAANLRAAGAVVGASALGVGGYQALAKAGVKLLTPGGIALQAAAVDAPIGAIYGRDAPGFLAAGLAELTGDPDLERNAIINGLEAAGIGALAGFGLRQMGINQLKKTARSIGWQGKTNADLRKWADYMRFWANERHTPAFTPISDGTTPPPAAGAAGPTDPVTPPGAPPAPPPVRPTGPTDLERTILGSSGAEAGGQRPEVRGQATGVSDIRGVIDPEAGLRTAVEPNRRLDIRRMAQAGRAAPVPETITPSQLSDGPPASSAEQGAESATAPKQSGPLQPVVEQKGTNAIYEPETGQVRFYAPNGKELFSYDWEAKTIKVADPAKPPAKKRVQTMLSRFLEAQNPKAPTKQPIKKGSRPPLPTRADGKADILDFINDMGGIRGPNNVRNPGGEYNGFKEAFSGVARMVVTQRGNKIDDVLRQFEGAGMGTMDPAQLYAKVANAVIDRARVKKQMETDQTREAFEAAALDNQRPKNNPADAQAIATDSLAVGDAFRVKRQDFEVTDVTPEGEVIVEDGPRFGTQVLPPGFALHPDRGTFNRPEPTKAAEGGAEDPFGLDEIAPPPVVNVDPRSGQSEMLPGDDATFSLSGGQMEDPAKQFQRSVDAREGAKDQLGMFDPNDVRSYEAEDGGSLFEPAVLYADRLEITDPKYRAGAIDYATRVLQSKNDAPGQAYLSLDQVSAPQAPSGLSDAAGGFDLPRFFRDPTHIDPQIRAALADGQRISAILPELVAGGIPSFNIDGKILQSSKDFALTQMALRSPYQESVKVAVLDGVGKVWHSEVQSLGSLSSSIVDQILNAKAVTIARRKGLKGKARLIMAHNHPSGDVVPSSADLAVAKQTWEWGEAADVAIVDFIVTNGDKFFSYRSATQGNGKAYYDFPTPHRAPWEAVPREDRQAFLWEETFVRVAHGLRQGNPNAEFILFTDIKNKLTGVQQMPPGSSAQDWAREMTLGAAETGGNGFFVITNQDVNLVKSLQIAAKRSNLNLLDASSPTEASYRAANILEPLARYAGDGPGQVREDAPVPEGEEVDPFDPAVPLSYIHQGQPPVPVGLGGLEFVKAIQMPELVHLARLFMAGQVPELKKLPRARGYFKPDPTAPGGGRIVLDKRIFRDQRQAAQTLAHEIGHFTDFLDDKTMNRGNILGRLSSLHQYLAHTIEELPETRDLRNPDRLTPDDRRKIQKDSVKKTIAELGPKPNAKDDGPEAVEIWNERRRDNYAQLIDEEIENRGLVTRNNVADELRALSEWWRPYDPAKATDSFKAYRNSGREIYADMISVLFNNPKELRDRAPVAWRMFFHYLENKPQAKADLVELWDFLSKPSVNTLKRREANLLASFARGEEILLRKATEREERYKSFRGLGDRLRAEYLDIFDPLTGRQKAVEKAGIKVPERLNMRHLFGEHPLGDNAGYRFLQKLYEKVIKPMEAEELTLSDLGLMMTYERVLNERFDITNRITGGGRSQLANTQGHTPDTARMGRMWWIKTNGLDRYQALKHYIGRLRGQVNGLIERAVDAGVYSRELYENVIKPNQEHYATFAVLDYLQEFVPATVKIQEGSFKDIANPFTGEVLKMLSLTRWVQKNQALARTRDFLQTYFPSEIVPAETFWTGKVFQAKDNPDPDGGQIDVYEDGRPVRYWVADKLIEKAFEGVEPASAGAISELLSKAFRSIIYPFIIRYNPAFQLYMGPMRDLRRTLVNSPKHTGIKIAGDFLHRWGSLLHILPRDQFEKDIQAYLRGESSPLINEMIENWALGTPYDNFRRDLGRRDSFEELMRRFALMPQKKRSAFLRSAVMKPLITLGEATEFSGLTFEMLPKVAAYKLLTRDLGWSRPDAAEFVRNHTGVPNFRERGRFTAKQSNAIFPFFQVMIKGYQHDARLAFNSKTAAGWWFRYFTTNGWLRVLQALGAAGALGAEIKEYYDRVSDYTKTNYGVLPIGKVPGGDYGWKTASLTIPEDETQRLIGGIIHHGIQALWREPTANPSNLLAFGAGQLPNLSPVIDVPDRWWDYVKGLNPRDEFTGGNILTNDQWLVKGWEANREMLLWTLDQTGVSNFVKYNPRWDTSMEMRIGALPIINRIIRVSDYGKREQQEKLQKIIDAKRAKVRIGMPDSVRRLYGETNALEGIRLELRTPEQQDRLIELRDWYRTVYKPTEELILETGEAPKPFTLRALDISSQPYIKKER